MHSMPVTTLSETEPLTAIPPPEPVYNCARCSHYLPEGTLACPECNSLAYGPHLNQLAAAAAAAEQAENLVEARERWVEALTWLPTDARQATQIHEHLATLGNRQEVTKAKQARWRKRLGPFAPVLLGVAKFKSVFFLLFKLKFLLGFVTFFALYWAIYGWKFAAGFMLSIFVHEMGHYVVVRSRGLKAELPVFLPGLGAYVKWYNQGVSLPVLASIALAGPLFGLGMALLFAGLYRVTHAPVFLALTSATAWLNLVNLIPVFMFDGAQATYALSRLQRALTLAACLILFAVMHEGVFLFLAAGMAWRLFTNDVPEQQTAGTLAAYLGLLFALGAVLYFVPMQSSMGR